MDDVPCFSIRGGLRDGWLNITWPLVFLKIYPDRLQLAGMTIPKEEIKSLSRYEGWFSSGVKNVFGPTRRSLIFWTFDSSTVLRTLQCSGYPADPDAPCMSQPTPRLMILAAMIAIVATIIALVWVWPALREPAIGSLESRQDFHRWQLAFREICQKNSVVGKPVAEVYSLFSGYQPLGPDDTLSWREWPCALVIRHGKVAGVFYHDYPYKMQPLPSDFVTENASPFFERYPQYLSARFVGSWSPNGAFVFERKEQDKPISGSSKP